jgi:anti-sigma regulatory factor (Ser/Thr protein kinase)
LGERNAELIHVALADTSNISFTDARAYYQRPASVIKASQQILARYVAEGAQQIRLVGEVPHPGTGQPWEWWARYEAAVNHALGEFPVWALCPYDTRITPSEVLADAVRTHPRVATADGRHVANARFDDPAQFLLTRRQATRADPLESTPPFVDLIDPAAAAARRAVRNAGRASHLSDAEIDDFIIAVSEVVTNAVCHGRPPVRLRLWSGPDRIVAAVTDQGPGPSQPFAGLLPTASTSPGGLGLWLAHQICSHVTLRSNDHGFTIRLTAGTPSLAA